jgi:hypothetical protein
MVQAGASPYKHYTSTPNVTSPVVDASLVTANVSGCSTLTYWIKESLLITFTPCHFSHKHFPEVTETLRVVDTCLNILGTLSQPVVIDWADARRGDPAADVCRSFLLLSLHAPQWATAYLDGYCETAGMSRDMVLDWLPYIAAARLAEAVPGEADRLLQMVDIP